MPDRSQATPDHSHATTRWHRHSRPLITDRGTPRISPHKLLTNPGLFARYGQLNWFHEVQAKVGTPEGPHGLWMIIPSHGSGTQPLLNGEAIPITNPAQFEILNEAWLSNLHR